MISFGDKVDTYICQLAISRGFFRTEVDYMYLSKTVYVCINNLFSSIPINADNKYVPLK